MIVLQYLKLRECEEISDADQRIKQLLTCQIMFKTTPALEKDARYVEEYVKLLKKQKQMLVCISLTHTHTQLRNL